MWLPLQQSDVQVAPRALLALGDVLEPRGDEHEGALPVGEGADHVRAPENEQLRYEGHAPRTRGAVLAVRGGCLS